MSNLLYLEHRRGCNVSTSQDGQSLIGFGWGQPLRYACYFADLKPNTTYTLKCYDSTSRFRVATYKEDVKDFWGSGGSTASITQWWIADSNPQITFTTGSDDIYLAIYYTNSSDYSIRVMLNEGSIAEDYTKPFQHLRPWYMGDNNVVSTCALPILQYEFARPFPASLMRIDESNGGLPYNELMSDILYRDPIPPPEPDNPERANWLSHWFIRLGDIDINKKSIMGYISQKADRTFQPANFKNSPHWNNSVQELNDIYYKMLGIDSVGGLIEWNYIEGGET